MIAAHVPYIRAHWPGGLRHYVLCLNVYRVVVAFAFLAGRAVEAHTAPFRIEGTCVQACMRELCQEIASGDVGAIFVEVNDLF